MDLKVDVKDRLLSIPFDRARLCRIVRDEKGNVIYDESSNLYQLQGAASIPSHSDRRYQPMNDVMDDI